MNCSLPCPTTKSAISLSLSPLCLSLLLSLSLSLSLSASLSLSLPPSQSVCLTLSVFVLRSTTHNVHSWRDVKIQELSLSLPPCPPPPPLPHTHTSFPISLLHSPSLLLLFLTYFCPLWWSSARAYTFFFLECCYTRVVRRRAGEVEAPDRKAAVSAGCGYTQMKLIRHA